MSLSIAKISQLLCFVVTAYFCQASCAYADTLSQNSHNEVESSTSKPCDPKAKTTFFSDVLTSPTLKILHVAATKDIATTHESIPQKTDYLRKSGLSPPSHILV